MKGMNMKLERMRAEQGAGSASTIEGIGAVSLATHDMARAVQFYRALGFTVRNGGEDSSFTSLHAGSGFVNLIAQPADRQWSWWGRVIFYVTDVDAFYARAVAAGLRPDSAPQDAAWGERFFHLTDPDGHELSFATPLPGAETPPAAADSEILGPLRTAGRGMTSKSASTPREQLAREITPELYRQIRRLWTRHSIAEDRRDLSGLLDTLTEDCVYEVVTTGQRWQGHAGARAFYEAFLAAFPDVTFRLVDIVIGPQGVIEVAEMTGTHQGPWAGLPPTGRPLRLLLVIHFPWDPAVEKFAGEKIYFDRSAPGF